MRQIIILTLILFSSMATASNVICYPERAGKLRIDGEVNVLYNIDENGRTGNIRIVSTNPKYVFDRSVARQISGWAYPKGNPQSDIPLRVIFKAN